MKFPSLMDYWCMANNNIDVASNGMPNLQLGQIYKVNAKTSICSYIEGKKFSVSFMRKLGEKGGFLILPCRCCHVTEVKIPIDIEKMLLVLMGIPLSHGVYVYIRPK